MLLRLNQVVFGLGRGVLGASSNRMGVWTQGCSLRKCPGCSSTHTWSPDGGKTVNVESLLSFARSQALAPSGLTVSGGEPTDQAEGITALIARFRETFPGTEAVLYTALHWPVLAKKGQTVVFYMGRSSLPALCGALVQHGLPRDWPAALVEEGTSTRQRVVVGTLADLPSKVDHAGVTGASLVIVGEVVKLRERLQWFKGAS